LQNYNKNKKVQKKIVFIKIFVPLKPIYTQSKVVFSKTLNLRLQKLPFSFGERDLGIEV